MSDDYIEPMPSNSGKSTQRGHILINGLQGAPKYGQSLPYTVGPLRNLFNRLENAGRPVASVGDGVRDITWSSVQDALDKVTGMTDGEVTVIVTGQVPEQKSTLNKPCSGYGVRMSDNNDWGLPSELRMEHLMEEIKKRGRDIDLVLCTDYAQTALSDVDPNTEARVSCLTSKKATLGSAVLPALGRRIDRQLTASKEESNEAAHAYLDALSGTPIHDTYLGSGIASVSSWPIRARAGKDEPTMAGKIDALLDENDRFSAQQRSDAHTLLKDRMKSEDVDKLMEGIESQIRPVPKKPEQSAEDGLTRYWHPSKETAGPGWRLIEALYEKSVNDAVAGGSETANATEAEETV